MPTTIAKHIEFIADEEEANSHITPVVEHMKSAKAVIGYIRFTKELTKARGLLAKLATTTVG